MAKISLCNMMYAKMKENVDGTHTYEKPEVIPQSVKADLKWQKKEGYFVAEERKAEIDKNITGGTLDIEVGYLTEKDVENLLGHMKDMNGVHYRSDDVAPYQGFGYIRVAKVNNQLTYKATFISKIIFADGDDSNQTSDPTSTSYAAEALNGEFIKAENGDLYAYKDFKDKTLAVKWILNQFGIYEESEITACIEGVVTAGEVGKVNVKFSGEIVNYEELNELDSTFGTIHIGENVKQWKECKWLDAKTLEITFENVTVTEAEKVKVEVKENVLKDANGAFVNTINELTVSGESSTNE